MKHGRLNEEEGKVAIFNKQCPSLEGSYRDSPYGGYGESSMTTVPMSSIVHSALFDRAINGNQILAPLKEIRELQQ
jgi:hypothetical protein